jgi:tryptophan 2,3-dioxygenase
VSIIKPRTRGKVFLEQRTRLDRANRETLYAYAAFLDEDVDYVMNQLIESVLERDREFATWRAQHQQSYAPPRVARSHRVGGSTAARSAPSAQQGPVVAALSARE